MALKENISIASLASFTRVAERRSFTDAARSLFLSESTVSKQVRTLENELGTDLFVRSKKGLVLTPDGRALLPRAQEVMKAVERFEETAALLSDASAHLAICHSGTAFETEVVAYAGVGLLEEHRGALLDIKSSSTERIFEWLLEGEADAIVASGSHVPAHGGIRMQPLCTARLVALVPRGHHFAGRMSVSLAELGEETFLFPSRSTIPIAYDWTVELLKRSHVSEPRIHAVDCADYGTIFSSVAAKRGVGLAASWYRNPLPHLVAYVPVSDADACYDLSLIWMESNDNPLLPVFVNAARNAVRTHFAQWCAVP